MTYYDWSRAFGGMTGDDNWHFDTPGIWHTQVVASAHNTGGRLVRTMVDAGLSMYVPDAAEAVLGKPGISSLVPYCWAWITDTSAVTYPTVANFMFSEKRFVGIEAMTLSNTFRSPDNLGYIHRWNMAAGMDSAAIRQAPNPAAYTTVAAGIIITEDPGAMVTGKHVQFQTSMYLRSLFKFPV